MGKAVVAILLVLASLIAWQRQRDARFGSDAPRAPVVQMTLDRDPDVGTLIDPGHMTDEQRGAIPGPLVDCLQLTLHSLELPPLAEGNTVKLQYSFRL